ncbi:MAG: NAD(P)H-binding protein [Gammaproteobacteria bacterium]|jgi:nucleoside-diphosphate-sugar epimerase|nr:NAD(P)H-binding protein [Gammaproteobacteria bacterium]MDP6616638.1 NAD(P)H-binding protein [Gammaproteobacteria bacterium]MDP6696099.1 NAD(P)H-binding protein [Gammaproteobacteria bacterium]MDP7041861.1 NAD(P)H-binding protein [Gammaproteobacteria bacterium]
MDRRTLFALLLLAGLTACSPPDTEQQKQGQANVVPQAPPKIVVIGATARSGRVIIQKALDAGYDVSGLARTPSKLRFEHPNLTLFRGDVRDVESLQAALTGDEVVICMVGYPTPKNPSEEIGPVDLYTAMGENLIKAMKAKGNTKLIMASSTGVEHRVPNEATEPEGDSMSDEWRFNARFLYNDMAAMETQIRESGLEYVLLRPGFLVEEPARNDMQFTIDGGTPKQRTITYEDFAAFTLAQVDSDEYVGKAVGMYSDEIMDPAKEVKRFLEKIKREQAERKAAEAGGS